MRRRGLAGLIAAAALLVAAPTAAHAAGAWLAPETIGPGDTSNRLPSASFDSHDTASIWTNDPFLSSNASIFLGTHAAGGPWTTSAPPSGAGARFQFAVDPAGDAFATWIGGTRQVFVAKRPAGSTWQAPIAVTAAPQQPPTSSAPWATDPQIAVDAAGDAVIAWGYVNPVTEIWAATWPAGRAIQAAQRVSTVGDTAEAPQVAVDAAGNAIVAYIDVDPNDSGGHYRPTVASKNTIATNTGNWSTPTVLSSAEADTSDITFTGTGTPLVVWLEGSLSSQFVMASTRTSAGVWQTTPTKVSGTTGETIFASQQQPRVVSTGNGDATVIWGYTPSTGNPVVASAVKNIRGWGSPTTLSNPDAEPYFPAVGINKAGLTVAAWTDHDLSGGPIQAAIRPVGGNWGAPTTVTTSGAWTDSTLSVAVDSVGDAVVAYDHQVGSAHDPAVVAFDASAPTLGTITAPATGVAGTPVSLSAPVTDAWGTPSVAWSFGDGASGAGASTSHTFAAAGTYTVSATASDTVGASAPQTTTITIAAPPADPTPVPTPDTTKNQLPPTITPAPSPVITKLPVVRVPLKLAGAVLAFDTDLTPTGKSCPKASKVAFKVTGGSATLKVKKHALKLAAAGKVCTLTGTITLSKTPTAKTSVHVALSAKGLSKTKLTATR